MSEARFRKTEYLKQEQFSQDGRYSPEDMNAQSQEVLSTLSPEDQQKYQFALDNARKIVAGRGYDPEAYRVYLQDNPTGSLAAYRRLLDQPGDNFVVLQVRHIRQASEDRLTTTLVHEILGHALNSVNWLKQSDASDSNITVSQGGLSIDWQKVITQKDMLATVYNLRLNHPLNHCQRDLADFVHTQLLGEEPTEPYDTEAISAVLTERIEQKKLAVDSEEFGKGLNEGVTEILAIRATLSDPNRRQELYEDSPYKQYVVPLVRVGEALERLQTGLQEQWFDTLETAQCTGSYKLLRDFLQTHGDSRVSPRTLASLRLDEVTTKIEQKSSRALLSRYELDPAKAEEHFSFAQVMEYPILLQPYLNTPADSRQILELISQEYPDNRKLLGYALTKGQETILPESLREELVYQNPFPAQVATYLAHMPTDSLDLKRILQTDSPQVLKSLLKHHSLPVEAQLELAKIPALQLNLVLKKDSPRPVLEYLSQAAEKPFVQTLAQTKLSTRES